MFAVIGFLLQNTKLRAMTTTAAPTQPAAATIAAHLAAGVRSLSGL
jgi:hypothetical protein